MRKIFILLTGGFYFFTISSQSLYQTVRGKVLDKDSNVPLIGATVVIAKSEPVKATISDLTGNFILENVPVGRHTLVISYVGYENYIIPGLLVGSAKEIILEVKLKEKVQQIDEATVVYKKSKDRTLNEMALVSGRQFTV